MTSSYRGSTARLTDAQSCYDAWAAEKMHFVRQVYLFGVIVAALGSILATVLLRPQFAIILKVPQTAAGVLTGVLLAAATIVAMLALVLVLLLFRGLKWRNDVYVRIESAT
jgi:hypothetical protein